MRLGIHLGNFGPALAADSVMALALGAERLGYDSVWVSDHVVVPETFESPYPYVGPRFDAETAAVVFEPVVTLAYVAGATGRIAVGTSVLVVPQRNPVVLAKQLATLDALCGGRLELGVGLGWMREEFEILGASFEGRGAALDEYLDLWARLWSDDAPEFHGELVDLPPVRFGPRPVGLRGSRISVGGNGPRSLRRAAARGCAWHGIRLGPDETAARVGELASLWREEGRDPAEMRVLMRCSVDVDGAGGDAGSEPWYLRGTLDAVARAVEEYARAGVTDLILTPAPGRPVGEAVAAMEELARALIAG